MQGSFTKLLMRGVDRSILRASKCRPRSILFPRPGVPKPQRRKNMKFRCFGTTIVNGNLDQKVFGVGFCIFYEHVEIAVVIEDSGIEQLILKVLACPFAV